MTEQLPTHGTDATAPVLKGPKRQHYLPRFFLKGFVGADGCLAVYDREKNEVRRQQPVNTGAVGHLYTLTDDQGRQRIELEQALSEVEAAAAEHLPALISGQPLSFEARGALAHFFGTLAVRTPEFIQSIQHFNGELIKTTSRIMFSTVEQAQRALRNNPGHAELGSVEILKMAHDMVDFTERGEYEVETDPQWAVTLALPMGEEIAQIMAERYWRVWKAPAGSAFVVADAPTVLTPNGPRPKGMMGLGFGSRDALTLLPLCSTHALAMFGERRKNDLESVDRRTVRRLNIELAKRSQRFLMGRDDALIASIARIAKLAETSWESKLGMTPRLTAATREATDTL
jgi:hypothetical protein